MVSAFFERSRELTALFAITRMRETFFQVVRLVTVMQNTWGYSFTAVYRLLRPFLTADICPSYQVCQLLSTKLELYVSEGFRLVLQFKKFWRGFKCGEDEVYVHVSSMECRTN